MFYSTTPRKEASLPFMYPGLVLNIEPRFLELRYLFLLPLPCLLNFRPDYFLFFLHERGCLCLLYRITFMSSVRVELEKKVFVSGCKRGLAIRFVLLYIPFFFSSCFIMKFNRLFVYTRRCKIYC